MRWAIRDQILVPILAIQVAAVTTITLASAALAARRSERQVVDRLNGVIETLGHADFPYTRAVLAQMRGLSGAHYVAYAEDGRVAETSFASLRDPPPRLPAAAPAGRVVALGASPRVVLDGVRYYEAPVRSPAARPLLVLYPETSLRQARWEAAMPSLALGGGSLALMAAATSLIAHRISRRLRRVERQVAGIAAGHFEEIDPGRPGDEVHDLARSINAMGRRLGEMSRAIRQSERARLLSQLGAGLAHQLRNSLTGARMSVQLHVRRHPAAAGDRSLEVALRQLAMTEEQVKGLLSLGRVERRPPAPCDVGALLRDVAFLIGPACEHAKVTLDAPREPTPIEVRAEESGLRAAVLNLALNAIEAAGPGGAVALRAIAEGDALTIEVSDDGPGPPPALAEAVFEPFATSKPEGVGLGLALARQVAAEHEGRLSWTREGGRTHFRLTLPRAGPIAKEAV